MYQITHLPNETTTVLVTFGSHQYLNPSTWHKKLKYHVPRLLSLPAIPNKPCLIAAKKMKLNGVHLKIQLTSLSDS